MGELEVIADGIRRVLGPETEVRGDMRLDHLGLDSFDVLELASDLDARGLVLDLERLAPYPTVADLVGVCREA